MAEGHQVVDEGERVEEAVPVFHFLARPRVDDGDVRQRRGAVEPVVLHVLAPVLGRVGLLPKQELGTDQVLEDLVRPGVSVQLVGREFLLRLDVDQQPLLAVLANRPRLLEVRVVSGARGNRVSGSKA